MIAVDTNMLVRYLVDDEPAQRERAATMIEAQPVVVLKTVILETEWVLRGTYKLPVGAVHDAFERLFGLDNLVFEDRDAIVRAMGWLRSGLGFADALHLASTPANARFATFDTQLRRRAERLASAPTVIEP